MAELKSFSIYYEVDEHPLPPRAPEAALHQLCDTTACSRNTGSSTRRCQRWRTLACTFAATTMKRCHNANRLQSVVIAGASLHVAEHAKETTAGGEALHNHLENGARLVHVRSEQTRGEIVPGFFVVLVGLHRLQILCNLEHQHHFSTLTSGLT